MAQNPPPRSPLTRLIRFHRWGIPVSLSALGLGYVVWEVILTDRAPLNSPQVLLGVALLGIIGPLLAFLVLSWAGTAAASLERAEQERDRKHRQLAALHTIGEAVNQSLELPAVLDRALDQVLQETQLEAGSIRLIEDGRLVLGSARAVSAEFRAAEETIAPGYCLCGRAAQQGELVAAGDLLRLPQCASSACAGEQFRSVVSVPIRAAERVVGVLHVAGRQPRTFDADDRALLADIGYQVGVALEKARLHAQLKSLNQGLEERVTERTRELTTAKKELAVQAAALRQVLAEERRVEEKTRARLAYDLHDGVQQLIIGTLYEAQAARDALAAHPETASLRLSAVQDLLRRMEAEMRLTIHSLRPLTLDVGGLVPALEECASHFESTAKLACELKVHGTPRRFNPEAEVAVYRIVQETLNNVQAHAQAQHVGVRLVFGPGELRVEVQDDGRGFDPAALNQQPRTHLGLIGMRERAASVGGAFQVQSRPGAGTCMTLRLPLAA